ncbi:MAG: alpha/beta hydrolase [Chloroflexota bacterium]
MTKIPLALLPGTLCDARLFAPQVEALADVATPTVVDVAQSDTLPATARDVLNAMPERFAIAGLSYGGIIAFEVWRQAPERVLGLALLNTTHLPPSAETKRAQQQFVGMATLGDFSEITMTTSRTGCSTQRTASTKLYDRRFTIWQRPSAKRASSIK